MEPKARANRAMIPGKRYSRCVTPIAITSGRVIIYRMFDIADEIDLTAVRDVRAGGRGRTASFIVRDTPATIDLGTVSLRLGTERHSAAIVARNVLHASSGG